MINIAVKTQQENEVCHWVGVRSPTQGLMRGEKQNTVSGKVYKLIVINNSNYKVKEQNFSAHSDTGYRISGNTDSKKLPRCL